MIHKLKVSVGNIEDAVATMLTSMRLIEPGLDIDSIRIPMKSKDGLVEISITTSERK